jgi:hypothetical protein
MSRRHTILAAILTFAVVIIPIGTNLTLSDVGRQSNVTAARAACYRSGPKNVAAINAERSDATSNHLVATDPTQSKRTRDARAAQVGKDLKYVQVLDAQTDQSSWRQLNDPADQNNVRYGMPTTHGRTPPFQCARVFPPSQFIP